MQVSAYGIVQTLDDAASKAALKSLADDPQFLQGYEVLLDWRDIHCNRERNARRVQGPKRQGSP
jgi:hypothetical protein